MIWKFLNLVKKKVNLQKSIIKKENGKTYKMLVITEKNQIEKKNKKYTIN